MSDEPINARRMRSDFDGEPRENTLPASGRSVGPVTLATGGAAAATTIICWALSLLGVDVPGEVQGSITVLLVLLAGYLVRPVSRGKRVAA